MAQARERWGDRNGAIAELRRIDLEHPASSLAATARTELSRLTAGGVRIAPYSAKERVERVERMLREAPIEQTTAEIDTLSRTRS